MASAYTDEDLYLHYRAITASDTLALAAVADHRAIYPLEAINTADGWTGVSADDRDRRIVQAVKRASQLPAGAERTALIDHALAGGAAAVAATNSLAIGQGGMP